MSADPIKQLPTLDDIMKLQKPTSMFLCPLSANKFGLEFLKFTIRNPESKVVLFNVEREKMDPAKAAAVAAQLANLPPEMETAVRSVRYNFPPSLLDMKLVNAKLVFSVGPDPVPGFRMVERHYFRDRLIKSFEFNFGFCIPNSTNEWDATYEVPELSAEVKRDMINHPFEVQSDSFYFANGQLIMHNKAQYAYNAAEPAKPAAASPGGSNEVKK